MSDEARVSHRASSDHRESEWRTGRKVGRTIYAMVEADPSDADVLIGMMDTPELAREAVMAHNRWVLKQSAQRNLGAPTREELFNDG